MMNPYNVGMRSSRLLTRRALARFAAAPIVLSATAPAQPPRPVDNAVAPSAARNRFQTAAGQLAAVKLPRNIEPATRFEA
jgi:hypothetical protein